MGNEAKKGKTTPSKKALYNYAAQYAREAVDVLVDQMRNGDNSNARTGAAKSLLNKVIPDLRAIEWAGDKDSPVPLVIITQDANNTLTLAKPSVGGHTQVQSDSSGEKVG